MSTTDGTKSATQYCLFDQLPLITTRLVCETHLPFSDRIQVSTPADVAGVLQEYFRDPERRPPSGSRNYVPRISKREPRVI